MPIHGRSVRPKIRRTAPEHSETNPTSTASHCAFAQRNNVVSFVIFWDIFYYETVIMNSNFDRARWRVLNERTHEINKISLEDYSSGITRRRVLK